MISRKLLLCFTLASFILQTLAFAQTETTSLGTWTKLTDYELQLLESNNYELLQEAIQNRLMLESSPIMNLALDEENDSSTTTNDDTDSTPSPTPETSEEPTLEPTDEPEQDNEFRFDDITVDNSNMLVDVYQQTTTGSTRIYHGALSGYDNGYWDHFDFSRFGTVGFFNWNGTSQLGVSIIPCTCTNDNTDDNSDDNASDNEFNSDGAFNDDELADDTNNIEETPLMTMSLEDDTTPSVDCEYAIVDVSLVDANNNRVNSLSQASCISSIRVLKENNANDILTLVVAEYEKDRFSNIHFQNLSNLSCGSNSIALNYTLNNITENTSIKLMLLDRQSLSPFAIPYDLHYGYLIDITTVINQTYVLPLTRFGCGDSFKLSFDPQYFRFFSGTFVGNTITETETGSLTINCDTDRFSTFIERFEFIAKKSGNTTISVIPYTHAIGGVDDE